MTLLTTRLAERCSPHQGLPRRRPTIRMGMVGIVDFKIVRQARCKIVHCIEIAALEKTPREDAQPQCDLVEPGAMFGRKMAHMLVSQIAQERPPLCASA